MNWSTTTALYDHQTRAVEKLRRSRVGGLFMDMGTGKTRAAMHAIEDQMAGHGLSLFKVTITQQNAQFEEYVFAASEKQAILTATSDMQGPANIRVERVSYEVAEGTPV
jgi:superfamily II DNA or RNA helicase